MAPDPSIEVQVFFLFCSECREQEDSFWGERVRFAGIAAIIYIYIYI